MQKPRLTQCPFCGGFVEQPLSGRPRVYHDQCRKLNQLLGWLEDLIISIELTEEKKRALRSRLWYTANLLNGRKKHADRS